MTGCAALAERASLLFRLDGAGRLRALNEHAPTLEPLAWVGVDAAGLAVAAGAGMPAETAEALELIARALPAWAPGGRTFEAATLALLREAVEALEPVAEVHCGPVFAFPPAVVPAFGAMQLYPAHGALLHPDLATLGPELAHRKPLFAVIQGGQAVSVCYSARANGQAAEAGVETAPAFRGQGCAALAVYAWALAVREEGRTPFYSTSWENAASLALARKLELEQVGEEVSLLRGGPRST